MVDSLQIGAAVVVIFVFALTTEILFAFCRVFAWIKRQVFAGGTQVTLPIRLNLYIGLIKVGRLTQSDGVELQV
jgi:hypothetical protein